MDRKRARRFGLFRILAPFALVALLTGSADAGPIGFAYALQQVNGGANQIYGFRFDQATGSLTLLPGFPMASGGTGGPNTLSEQLTYGEGRLFVVNDGNNTLTVFSVNRTTGALTTMPYNPIVLGEGNWTCVTVHPTGSPVVVGDFASNRLSSVVVTDLTADAAPGNPFLTGAAGPFSCQFSQAGTHIYAGGIFANLVAGFSVDSGTGVLTALDGSPFDFGGTSAVGYASDRNDRLFSVIFGASQVRAFTTAAGVPTAVAGNPFASGLTNGVHGVLHPSGFYMAADRTANRVGVYQIAGAGAATTMTPVAGSPFVTGGIDTNALVLTPNGTHLLAANATSRNLTVFQVNQASGALTAVGTQAANTLGATGLVTGLAFAPVEATGFVYALQQVSGGANQIRGFHLNPATAALTALPGFPVAAGLGGSGSFSDHLAYRNGRLYVVNELSATLSAFRVDRTTGALTALPFSPIPLAGDLACVAVPPAGSPVAVAGNAGLASLDVNPATATAAPGSPFATTGASPFSCAFSANGSFVYTGGNVGTTFAGFSVNPATGVLTPLAGSPFSTGAGNPVGYATDGAGRLFVSNFGTGVSAFTTAAGIPTGVTGNPFASGLAGGVHGIVNPLGFYMVADRSANRVGVFQIAGNGAATTLTAVAGSPFASDGSFTDALTQNMDGRLVVAANGVSRNLTVFEVNPITGVLTSAGTQAVNTLGAAGLVTGLAFAEVSPPFFDDPVTAMTSVIRAFHILDLRARIDSVRAQYGLGQYAYADPTLTVASTRVRAVHVTDLRLALGDVYTALGVAAPSYTDPTLSVGVTVVKASHIMQLRAAILAVE